MKWSDLRPGDIVFSEDYQSAWFCCQIVLENDKIHFVWFTMWSWNNEDTFIEQRWVYINERITATRKVFRHENVE